VVRKDDAVRLDTHAFLRLLEAGGVKRTWLAARVGVAPKTVSRWATGKVKRLARANAEALAEVLGCDLAEITASDEADVLATREEQRMAARLIQHQDLLELLSPSDDWALAESLIRATLQPDLPLRDLGRLYNLLATAAWRQGKYADASGHAGRAREIAERTGDAGVLSGAAYNQAVIDSLTGDLAAAIAGYERCLERDAFDSPRERGKVLSNLADGYRSLLRLDESVAAQREAIAVFEGLGLDQNLAIAFVNLGAVLTEAGRPAEAGEAYARGEDHARRARYARGVDCAPFYRADALALQGEAAVARDLVREALPTLARHAVYDLGCHAIAARVLRRAGDLDGAAAQVAEGLRRAEPFPELLGAMRLEEARLALARGDAAGEARAREAANAAFRRAGLAVRVRERPVVEHGAVTTS